jgi:predicted enzyme related to lactoylglutathione lyase
MLVRMKALGLRTLIYPARDLQAVKRWYAAALETEPYFDEPFYVGFNVGGYELGLSPSADEPVTYWGVDDPQAALEDLVGQGATVTEAVHDVGDGILVATVRDPFGHLVGLIRNPHFKVES